MANTVGGVEAHNDRVEAGGSVTGRDIRVALCHRERRGDDAWFYGGGVAAAAYSGHGCVEVGECGVEGGGKARARPAGDAPSPADS